MIYRRRDRRRKIGLRPRPNRPYRDPPSINAAEFMGPRKGAEKRVRTLPDGTTITTYVDAFIELRKDDVD